ncbi:MAG: hypothetical protein IPM36_05120 [Lewinellaceae bacterium]|nr:hypothetical protein [Lewinellaceae bacterium]
MALSGKRAEAVIDALNKRGVNTSNLSGHGVGPLSPASTNKSESGKSKNRRVELVVKIE